MNILGISAHFHNAACCLVRDGELVAAAQEESFTRVKHDARLPVRAARYCLKQAGLTVADLDCVAYYENPRLKLARQLWTYGADAFQDPWLLSRLGEHQPGDEIRDALGFEGRVEFCEHHHAHAASAYFWSGYGEAAIMTVDGVGEWTSTLYGVGRGGKMTFFDEVQFPHSLGLLYSTLTSYLGFGVNDGEYKVMGLAPYGEPALVNKVWKLVTSDTRGGFELDLRYFDFTRGDRMYSELLPELLEQAPRQEGAAITSFHKNLARSLQFVLERILVAKSHYLHAATGCADLCMAGGVALNCVANSRILSEGPFERLFVQPAANDAGGALGAAAIAHERLTGAPVLRRPLEHVYLGPGFDSMSVLRLLRSTGMAFGNYTGRTSDLLAATAERLAAGKVVGWFQGRIEFGPRALGARSILADPRDPHMRDRINKLVKRREEFRPFAPAVLASKAAEHFSIDHPSPFMLETFRVTSALELPAITHLDNSARVQTVDPSVSPRFAGLLEAFEKLTGCPILLNTSFNMKDEPIVSSPVDALICFVRSNIDVLVMEDFLIDRSALPSSWPLILAAAAAPPERAGITHAVYTLV